MTEASNAPQPNLSAEKIKAEDTKANDATTPPDGNSNSVIGSSNERVRTDNSSAKKLNPLDILNRITKSDHGWIIFLMVLITIFTCAWVGTSIFTQIKAAKEAPTKESVLLPAWFDISFKPTLYHSKYEPHGNLQTYANREEIDQEVQRFGKQLEAGVKKAVDESLAGTLEPYEKRLDDTWSAVQGIGLISAITGLLITILVLYFSFQNSDQIQTASDDFEKQLDIKAQVIIDEMLEKVVQEKLSTILESDSGKNILNSALRLLVFEAIKAELPKVFLEYEKASNIDNGDKYRSTLQVIKYIDNHERPALIECLRALNVQFFSPPPE